MVNEQIKTILNKLDGLVQENPDLVANGISIEQFINECRDNNSPLSAIVNCLLETIREKDEEISKQNQTIANYQAQTQGIYSRLQRRPRRLSLQEEKNNKSEVSFPLLSPRVGSLAADFDRPSPRKRFGSLPSSQVSSPVPFDYSSLSSPLSINSPVGNNPNPNLDIPVLDQVLEEMAQESEIAEAQEEELNTLRQQVSLLQRQLESQAKTIENFEVDQQSQIQQLKEKNTKIEELQANFKKQEEKIESLKEELRQTNDDYYQDGLKKDRLTELLRAEKATNKRLEEQLAKEVNENQCLKDSQNKTNKALFDKFKELKRAKKLAEREISSLKKIINDQTQEYREESQARELEYRKKAEHLVLLQVADKKIAHWKNPALRRFHSQSISLPVSRSETRRNSFYGNNENSVGGPSLHSPLCDELNQAMKGNFFATELTNSPETEIANNPLDAVASGDSKKRKRKSTSLIFNQPNIPDPETQNIEQGLEDILNEVADLVEDKMVQQKETSHQREAALLAEIKALKDNQAHLENSWKTLKDDYDALEKSTAELRSQLLVSENERQKLQEEIDSLKYQLAEAQTHKFRLEKEVKNESTAELVAERNKLKEELTTVQNKLDGMYSENAKLATQKLTEVNRVYDKVYAIEAQLQKEKEEHAATKKQLLAQQQEVERLKVDQERLKKEKELTESSGLTSLLEIKDFLNTDLARSMKEIEVALENQILIKSK